MSIRHLHKFGGSSLADADCYKRVAHILLTHGQSDDLIVVSAAGKTTNRLYELLDGLDNHFGWQQQLELLHQYQQRLIEQSLQDELQKQLLIQLREDIRVLHRLLSLEDLNDYQQSQIIAFGELWSSRLLAALLAQSGVAATALDARQVLLADEEATPQVRETESSKALQQFIGEHPQHRIVITGFICANERGQTLLFGRNGSDYSATLITRLANADRVTIWTDVEGVFNADPNRISDAKLLRSMSLLEANRLAGLGSPVLHSRCLQPLQGTNISLAVRSSYAPHTDFTLISPNSQSASQPVVTALAKVERIVCRCDSDFLSLLSQLDAQDLPPLAHWRDYNGVIELAYTTEQAPAAVGLLKRLAPDCGLTQITRKQGFGLVALVSSAVQDYRQGFARLLNRAAKPLYQDAHSLVTLVREDQVSALAAQVHRRCAGPRKRFGIVLMGTGNIGQAWLTLFAKARTRLQRELEAEIQLVGVVSSSRAIIDGTGINAEQWQLRHQKGLPWSYEPLLEQLSQLPYDEVIALDVSASSSLTLRYPDFFNHGIHLVSANKLAGSGPLPFYRHLKQQIADRRLFWRYNASVGAGLPIQYAINDLRHSGDKVQQVGGIFSGTLCWLFEHFDGSTPFSQLVLNAKELGITEPDPRDDLSGRDMQRKLLILAREMGLELELDDIELQSLVPESLADLSLDEFLERIDELDAPMQQALTTAKEQGLCIRYVASLTQSETRLQAGVGLQQVGLEHAYANLTPGDNVFVVTSEFYQDNPLIIRGPGAGREVTAAAVQTDLAQICRDLLAD
ncbi:bifunctional aspartate kinase/homoserine dehydrogenase II [Paraferrimonas haliotis]|uniref:Bifunctional aspartokinase/homoserine dehydrogenase n=1 Tax=Paraferrimonas haliotis TaxID=2013866 RepID=A0AA37TSJ2_9GAMM|nr:bifunctional aspartate kinase/homoserine dehydrogenase II [Paraferrimonas haliotis]GLS82314.1 bifunctional aspartate kinase/homoserine dehydrogenase II [Paraferrimonas haliotis]